MHNSLALRSSHHLSIACTVIGLVPSNYQHRGGAPPYGMHGHMHKLVCRIVRSAFEATNVLTLPCDIGCWEDAA
jgi:hypothetical protein